MPLCPAAVWACSWQQTMPGSQAAYPWPGTGWLSTAAGFWSRGRECVSEGSRGLRDCWEAWGTALSPVRLTEGHTLSSLEDQARNDCRVGQEEAGTRARRYSITTYLWLRGQIHLVRMCLSLLIYKWRPDFWLRSATHKFWRVNLFSSLSIIIVIKRFEVNQLKTFPQSFVYSTIQIRNLGSLILGT